VFAARREFEELKAVIEALAGSKGVAEYALFSGSTV
jgi:hypothetical protein